MQKFSKFILKLFGWKTIVSAPEPSKSVICVAPHTSNWDFPIGKLTYWSLGRDASFLIKKSWFKFPLNIFFKSMGGVPVDRSKRNSVTQQMVEEFNKRDKFQLAITPEGTRSLNHKWKMGFYHIAVQAEVPIQIAYIDYSKKEMGIKTIFEPTGNEENDLKQIQSFYKGIKGKFPERFNLNE
ncbi:MAG: lysophospholipid acyltransferase family protein [Paludibacter sp.]|nr:lysophospholipid acyltransferase family protein [Paludibacter sp.]